MTTVVPECVRELRPRAADKHITVRTSLEAVALEGDEALLRRMFSNLLGKCLSLHAGGRSRFAVDS